MSIELAVSIYIIVGLIDWFFGYASRQIHQTVKTAVKGVKDSTVKYMWLRVAVGVPLIFFGSLALYPLLYLIIFYDWLNAKKGQLNLHERSSLVAEFNNDRAQDKLYFSQTNGVGNLHCQSCNYVERLTCYTHGLDWTKTGVQCEACGEFCSIDGTSAILTCNCGGKLRRDEAIFCPKCRSNNVEFKVSYMT